MPHDPELVAETRGWLAKASLDLRAATHEEARRAFEDAEAVYGAVLARLPPAVAPQAHSSSVGPSPAGPADARPRDVERATNGQD